MAFGPRPSPSNTIGSLISEQEILQYEIELYFLAALGLKTIVTVISEFGQIVPLIG